MARFRSFSYVYLGSKATNRVKLSPNPVALCVLSIEAVSPEHDVLDGAAGGLVRFHEGDFSSRTASKLESMEFIRW